MDSLNRVLQKILNGSADLRKGIEEARILELWAKAVGPQIANRSRALQIKDKTILIAVDHPVWKQELLANKNLVLEKLNEVLAAELGQAATENKRIEEIFIVNPTTAPKGFRKK
jgi:predicted nucleic acid-binding Zn ribbon protein